MLLKFILRMALASVVASLAAIAIYVAAQSALAQPVEHATAYLSLF